MNYTPEQKAAWDRVLQLIEEHMDMPSFNTWFKPLSLHAVTESKIIIVGENAFNLQHMQNRYGTMLLSTVDMVFKRRYELEFYTQAEIGRIDRVSSSEFNEKYTFESFVVGSSNSLAHAAALAVAQQPSDVYNPLFIYGGVGLGKTHLMNAVGNYVLRTNPSANVLLMTSEMITNQLIEGIARKNTSELRNKLRSVDYLMVDDIQFLSKTKATQEEFFHTFNALYEKHKQIIISSDRPPKEIPEIEERLRSRFERGLIVDIQKPDFETRVAILKKNADAEDMDVPFEVLEYIARQVNSNIRELEGALTSLYAHSHLMGTPITLELAQSALNHLIKDRESRQVTPKRIIEIVADRYGVQPSDITGKRRSQDIAMPRQVAMYIGREMTDISTTGIGKAFGDRDHTTVLHGCDKIASSIEEDIELRHAIEELMRRIEDN